MLSSTSETRNAFPTQSSGTKPTLTKQIQKIDPYSQARIESTIREVYAEKEYSQRNKTLIGRIINWFSTKPSHGRHALILSETFKRDSDTFNATELVKGIAASVEGRNLNNKRGNVEAAAEINQGLQEFRAVHEVKRQKEGYTKEGVPITPEARQMTQDLEIDSRYRKGIAQYKRETYGRWWAERPYLERVALTIGLLPKYQLANRESRMEEQASKAT